MPIGTLPRRMIEGQSRDQTTMKITEEQMTEIGMTWGLTGLIGYMLFIIWNLARKSNAGRFGTFILFFVLAFGMLGFIAKSFIQWYFEME